MIADICVNIVNRLK